MEVAAEVVDGYTLLLHGVAVADGDGVVVEGVVVHGDAEGGSDGILTAIAAADGVLLVVLQHVVMLEEIHDFASLLGEAVFLDQGEHGGFVGSEHGGEVEHGAVEPSGRVSSFSAWLKMARKVRSTPIEVSIT